MVFQLARWLWQQYPDHEGKIASKASIPSTANHNTDLAELQIGSRMLVSLVGNLKAPDQIYLAARMKAFRNDGEKIEVTLQNHSHPSEPILLYPESAQDHACSGVVLEGLGYGEYLWDRRLIPFSDNQLAHGVLRIPSPVYCHSFITQAESLIFQENEHVQEMRGYGGYHRPGCRIEEIQQIFFTIRREGQQAAFYLSSLSDWYEKGLVPPQGGQGDHKLIDFLDCGEKTIVSLRDAIHQGHVSVQLVLGVDEEGQEVVQVYHSFQIKNTGLTQVMIGFAKVEEL